MDIVTYGFKNGEFVKNTYANHAEMTEGEKHDAFVVPSVNILTAPIKGPFGRVGNFILKNGAKKATLGVVGKAVKDKK